jgi:ABC-2 type transport system ATP-binding protein
MTAAAPVSAAAAKAPATANGIELRNASRWYGNVVAVNDVSTTLTAGITGVLGPNGAGKTTVLHMMAGLLTPSAGHVLVNGTPAAGNPGLYRSLALVPERESVHAFLTGREFVRMSAKLQALPNVEEATRAAIALVDLEPAQDRRISTYSKGMRQRIKVAGAIVHDPMVLLLDEPFNGMDPRQRLHMMDVLRSLAAQGRVIVISSHILEELNDLATNVLVMVSGRLAASGHFREIRKLMTDRPHTFTIKSSDNRALASVVLTDPSVFGVELSSDTLTVRTADRGALTRHLARKAREARIRVHEIRPTDESLESVFSYLVDR